MRPRLFIPSAEGPSFCARKLLLKRGLQGKSLAVIASEANSPAFMPQFF
jgi:hypothetical protein